MSFIFDGKKHDEREYSPHKKSDRRNDRFRFPKNVSGHRFPAWPGTNPPNRR